MNKVAIFMCSDLRNYGGGEKDIIRYSSQLKDKLEIHICTFMEGKHGRVSTEFIEGALKGVKIHWYKGLKSRLLKDVFPFSRFNLSSYDKTYSACPGFILNSILLKKSKRTLLGIHVQSALSDRPIENKAWKMFLFKFYRRLQVKCILKFDEIRVQNTDDLRRVRELGFKGRIWNIPPSMFDITPAPIVVDKFYVVWVNRISPEKRPEELVKIAKMLPDIEFHAIGSGSLSYLFDSVANIKKVGFLSDEELSDELKKASLYISTSRGENFGMSAVEAQAYGVPTITYDVMGLRDYNPTVKTTAEMAMRIREQYEKWIKSPADYHQERLRIRALTLQKFSDEVVIPQIRKMLLGSQEESDS